MNDKTTPSLRPPAAASAYLPLLLGLFVGSGCAALIYEIVWFQALQLVIGASALSLGVLLGTFMGGMCLGSLLLPRMISPHRHPLRVYAALEMGIGACGLLLWWGLPLGERGYPYVPGGLWMRCVVAGVCLLPPTVLMGATRWRIKLKNNNSQLLFPRVPLRPKQRRSTPGPWLHSSAPLGPPDAPNRRALPVARSFPQPSGSRPSADDSSSRLPQRVRGNR